MIMNGGSPTLIQGYNYSASLHNFNSSHRAVLVYSPFFGLLIRYGDHSVMGRDGVANRPGTK